MKTDKRDARELVDRLDRYLRGNTKVFSVVKVPTPEQEQARCVTRQRGAALKERNRCVVRGYGMMLAQGVQAPCAWWRTKRWEEFAPALPLWLQRQVELWQKKAVEFDNVVAALNKEVVAQGGGKALPKGLGGRLAIDLWRIETGQCSAQDLGLVLMPSVAKA